MGFLTKFLKHVVGGEAMQGLEPSGAIVCADEELEIGLGLASPAVF